MKVNEGANGPIQEQVAQPGSGEKVNEEELNLFIVAENVQQSENMAANEDQEILQIEVTEPKLLISNSLDLKHTKKSLGTTNICSCLHPDFLMLQKVKSILIVCSQGFF